MNALTEALQISKLIKVVPRSRNLEALLLFFAAGLNAFEIAQIQLSILEKMTTDLFTYWLPPVLFGFLLHMILRRRASEADPLILPIALVLNGLGIAMIYRLDLATIASGGEELFAFRQVMWTALAMGIAAIVILFIPSQLFLRRYVLPQWRLVLRCCCYRLFHLLEPPSTVQRFGFRFLGSLSNQVK